MKVFRCLVILVFGLCLVCVFTGKGVVASEYEYSDRIKGDIFEKQGGHVHPFLSVSSMYTDNLYTSLEDKIEDYAAIITPGIWLALPGRKTPAESIETNPESVGGVMVEPFASYDSRRFSMFVSGNLNIERYMDHSDEDTETGAAEAQLRYRAKSGVSLSINGQSRASHDKRGTEFSTQLREYTSNYMRATLGFNPNGKLFVTGGYSFFNVDYDSEYYQRLNRLDNTFFFDVGYPVFPKTDMYVECKVYDVDYKEDIWSDWVEKHYSLGIRWRVSSKSLGFIKAGYGERDADGSDNADNFVAEARMNYVVTSDTMIYSTAYKKNRESIYQDIDYVDSLGMSLGGIYEVTSRIVLDVMLEGAYGDYYTESEKRFDSYEFSVMPSIAYYLKKWAVFRVAYMHERLSNSYRLETSEDAVSNTVYFSVFLGV